MREGMGSPGQSFPWPYGYLHRKKNPLQVSLPPWCFCNLKKVVQILFGQICSEWAEKILLFINNPFIPQFFSNHEVLWLKKYCLISLPNRLLNKNDFQKQYES